MRGFQSGDIVRAIVPGGKKAGVIIGRVAIRASGRFNVQTTGVVVKGIGWQYCRLLHCADGYFYATTRDKKDRASSPFLRQGSAR
ncbi:MAG: hypothetical protein J2P48_17460 [Alphaproteobacteria bacterium]|nr:hypothetical protein [Alphaproteobacteria bacterium]